jgi:hypothetical protein
MTSTIENDFIAMAHRDEQPISIYEPFTVVEEHPEPLAQIDPDTSKGWIHRIAPMLRARSGIFGIALGLSAVSMVAAVAVPRVVGLAINNALTTESDPLGPFIWLLFALAIGRAITTLFSRFFLFKVAYGLEYDKARWRMARGAPVRMKQ